MLLYGFSIKSVKTGTGIERTDITYATIYHDGRKIGTLTKKGTEIKLEYISTNHEQIFKKAAASYVRRFPEGADMIRKTGGMRENRALLTPEQNVCADLIHLFFLLARAKRAWAAGYEFFGMFRRYNNFKDELQCFGVNREHVEEIKQRYPYVVGLLTRECFTIC